MNKRQIYLDTDSGALLLVRSDNNLDMVDVFRCTGSSTKTKLGFLLCVQPNTRTLHGKLTDGEFDALTQYLAAVAALRSAERAANVLVGDAGELVCSTIMDPDGARMFQEAAAMLRAILDLKSFKVDVFAPSPALPIRRKPQDREGFCWSYLVGSLEEIYCTGEAVTEHQDEVNPFRQTLEQRRLLGSLDEVE